MLAVVGLSTAVTATPAYAAAQDRGRHCQTYYHLGDPATNMGFTVCVKLQYDPDNLGMWRATASVTTTTPGMVLHTANLVYWDYDITRDEFIDRRDSDGPAASAIYLATPWQYCSYGSHIRRTAFVDEWVTWPTGVNSQPVRTYITGNMDSPYQKWWEALCL